MRSSVLLVLALVLAAAPAAQRPTRTLGGSASATLRPAETPEAAPQTLSGSAPLEIIMPDGSRVQSGVVATVEVPAAPTPRTRKVLMGRSFGTYPRVSATYGRDRDGHPGEAIFVGTVTEAGSLRLCRPGHAAVSRWLRLRLDTPHETLRTTDVVVAVRCDELAASHYLGRRFRVTAEKSSHRRPVRMAHDDIPETTVPLYLTRPEAITSAR